MEKKLFYLFITETLQTKCEIEASGEEEAMQQLQDLYKHGGIVLDDSHHIETDFTNCKYSTKETRILKQINDFCQNHCGECDNCCEGECVLFRITKIIEEGFYED